MKILLIHQYFNTPEQGGPLRSYYLATALVKAGFEIKVITTHNEKVRKVITIDGIEVHYLPVVYNNSFGFFRRVYSFLKFVISIVREAGKFSDADVCYAISTPLTTGLAAKWINWRYGIPYYFEVGDLWPEAPVQLQVIRNPVLKRYLYWLERRIYQSSRKIVALSEDIRKAIQSKAPGKPICLIPNMGDTVFFTPSPRDLQLPELHNPEGKFVVSYIGTLGMANGLAHLLQCAEEAMNEDLPVQFIICGEGAMRDELLKLAERKNLSNLTFIGFQNRNGVREILNATDAIFVSFQNLPVLTTGSPNKYFDGLAAGKLIIINFGGWIKNEIESAGCGFSVDQEKPGEFVRKLRPYVESPETLKSAGRASRELADRRYSREMLSAEFASIFKQ